MTATTLVDRALLRISGDDPRAFLQGLVTNDVAGVLPVWAGLLTPQGKALFDFLIWADGDDLLLDCEAAASDDLVRRLSLYRLRRRITIVPEPDLAVHWSREPSENDAVGHVADPRLAALGYRWLAPGGQAALDWTAHRLSLGVMEGRDELGDGTTLWLECNGGELHGVSYAKGCYVGQENTARMHHRAKVNRRLVVMPFGIPGERTRMQYADLGIVIDLRRIDDLAGALIPDWLAAAL